MLVVKARRIDLEKKKRMAAFVGRLKELLMIVEDGKLCNDQELAKLRRDVLRYQSLLTPTATNSMKLALWDNGYDMGFINVDITLISHLSNRLTLEQKDRHVATKAHEGAVKRAEAKDQLLRQENGFCLFLLSLNYRHLGKGSNVGMMSV